MRGKLHTQTLFSIVAIFAAVLVCTQPVMAQEATSTSFTSRNSTINSFAGSATSTSFSEIRSGDQTGGGESTSTSFVVHAGFLYFDSFAPRQQNWRWYDDETNETPSAPLASENVAPANIGDLTVSKLRVTVAEIAGLGEERAKFRLQFSTSSDFSTGAYNVVEAANCTGTSMWCYADGAGIDGDLITTATLSDADACVASVGDGCGTHNESGTTTSTFTHRMNVTAEYEFTVLESGASVNTVFFFRLFDTASGSEVPLNTGETHPSLSSAGTTLTFTIGGIPASTLTSGTTTTIETTSDNVPFGSLLINSSALGAQRLTVTTNAGQGYTIFSYAQQNLVGSLAAEIPPVAATNQNPLGWTTACATSASGCYGYHTSDAVLAGASTRFAADDTFAQFSTTSLSEVAYSSGPVTDRITDIVYKVEVHEEQTADNYTTGVVYIVVPTF